MASDSAAAIIIDHVIRQVRAASDSARRRCHGAWLLPPALAIGTIRTVKHQVQPTLE